MKQPSVCCVCLTADRQQMTDRAVRSFLAQDYPNKLLMILDSGREPFKFDSTDVACSVWCPDYCGWSIGKLRNAANWMAVDRYGVRVLVHLDSDDLSAPTRISDQVKLLVESAKQAVGYREMLFWDSTSHIRCAGCGARGRSGAIKCDYCPSEAFEIIEGLAWLYRNTDPHYALATSLCYWRRTWEAKPFPDQMVGSERAWLKGLDTLSVPGATCVGARGRQAHTLGVQPWSGESLMMLATIHGSNTSAKIVTTGSNPDGSPQWQRVPAWDNRVREILEGA